MTGRMIWFSGRVQGVGFRATAAMMARDYSVTGWVRNGADGRVQMLVEGPESDVLAFLDAMRKRVDGFIVGEKVQTQPATGKYREFAVTR